MSSWAESIKNRKARWVVIGVIGVLAIFVVLLAWLAVQLAPDTPTDEAARLQALAAAGGLLASLVLIAVTAAYVVLTGDMVAEAREARFDAVRPSLSLRIDPVGPVNNVFTLVSTGQGTALDLDLVITFHPGQQGGHLHQVRWRAPSLSPGESAQFMPKNPHGQVELNTQTIVSLFGRVTVTGTMQDSVGRAHNVDITLDDLPSWQTLLAAASQRYVEPPLERIAKTLEKLEKKLS